jgi:hypothetical protein
VEPPNPEEVKAEIKIQNASQMVIKKRDAIKEAIT